MGLKKAFKKSKKAVKHTANEAAHLAKEAGDEIEDVYEVAIDETTGAIHDVLEEMVDLSKEEVHTACKYADKKLAEAKKTLQHFEDAAVKALYKELYQKHIKEYGDLIISLNSALDEAFGKKRGESLSEVQLLLMEGKFRKADQWIDSLLEQKSLEPAIKHAHSVMGTCFVVAADISPSISSAGGTGIGGSGVIGMARHLGTGGEIYRSAFAVAGGSVGQSFSAGSATASGSVQAGISAGFLAKDPLNISGVFIDLAGQVSYSDWVLGVAFGFPPPDNKSPYVHTWKPTTGFLRGAINFSTSGPALTPGASISLGASYTWIIQKVKS
jgi:hypothetical protein